MPGPSSEALAEKQHVIELALQKVADTLDNHLERCADGQDRVDERLGKIEGVLGDVMVELKKVSNAQLISASKAEGAAEARKPKWWTGPVTTIGAVLLTAAIGTFGWMMGRLVSDNDKAIQAAQMRPTATVTVQSPAVPVQPAPIYPGPVLPANPAPQAAAPAPDPE